MLYFHGVNISFDNVDESKTNWAKIHFWLATVDLRQKTKHLFFKS